MNQILLNAATPHLSKYSFYLTFEETKYFTLFLSQKITLQMKSKNYYTNYQI